MNFAELLKLKSMYPKDMKLHLAIGQKNRNEPWIELSEGRFQSWQGTQTKPNFTRPFILSFVYIGKDEWLFAGIYTAGEYSVIDGEYHYATTLTDEYREYIGRIVVTYQKDFRQSYLLAEKYVDKLEIIEIFREKYVCDPFPGYANVCISFDTLSQICRTEEVTWKTALSAVYVIYLITDTLTGKQYVGKADGNEAIWQRWSAYASTGHGLNIELLKIFTVKGMQYFENFQYSILEFITKNNNQSYIDDRENYWKMVLRSKDFGYNGN